MFFIVNNRVFGIGFILILKISEIGKNMGKVVDIVKYVIYNFS